MEWNKKVRDHLQQLEVTPPKDSWNSIQNELDKGKLNPLSSPYAKAITWLKYSAAAVVIGFTMFTFIDEPFRNNLQNAVMGPGTKAAVIDSTPANQIDSIPSNDSIR
jgi:hypothetical protein